MVQKALDMEIMMQTGVPSIYELDPTTDELVKVYECVDLEGYRALKWYLLSINFFFLY